MTDLSKRYPHLLRAMRWVAVLSDGAQYPGLPKRYRRGSLMYLDDTPISALRTPCIPGCFSTVYWSYDSGEPMTRHYPGSPDFFTPEQGCSEDHLDQLVNLSTMDRLEGELYRQLHQWEIILDGARRSKHSSCTYLGVRPRSLTNPRGY